MLDNVWVVVLQGLQNLGRKFIGIELNKKYFEIAKIELRMEMVNNGWWKNEN